MRLVWIVLLFFCSLGANSQGHFENTNDLCFYRLDEWIQVLLQNQDRCSADIQKSNTNLQKTFRESLTSLERRLISKMESESKSQHRALTAITSRIDNLAKKLATATTYLEASLCKPWKTKLGGAKLTKLSTGVYHFNIDQSNKKSWLGAREFCENHGMNLVNVETVEEMRVVAAASPYDYYWYWVGASDIGRVSGQVHWTDGRVVDRSLFMPGYPKTSQGRETCIELRMHGKHRLAESKLAGDYECHSEKQCFICEVAAENSQCALNF